MIEKWNTRCPTPPIQKVWTAEEIKKISWELYPPYESNSIADAINSRSQPAQLWTASDVRQLAVKFSLVGIDGRIHKPNQMKLKTARQIIDGFPAHLKRKHRGRREVSPKDIYDAQDAYLQRHLTAYFEDGLSQGRASAERPFER